MDNFNLDQYIDIIADSQGAPARLFRSEDEKAALRKARQEQEMAAMMTQAAPQVAGAVKDIAQAQSYA